MQTTSHPDQAALEGFLEGSLPDNRGKRIAWHLASCQICRDKLLQFPQGEALLTELLAAEPAREPVKPNYDAIIDASYGMLMDREFQLRRDREQAHRLCEELLAHPAPRRRVLIQHAQQFQTWGLCEHLLACCFHNKNESAEQAIELAALAIEIANVLPESEFGKRLLGDLQARAWGHLANAKRVASDYPGADAALARAKESLRQGTGDPLEKARVLSFEASLRITQHKLEEAEELLVYVQRVYRRLGDIQQLGRTLVKMAHVLLLKGKLDKAIAGLFEAVKLIDHQREPDLWETAIHNLADAYSLAGRFMEARALLTRNRDLFVSPAAQAHYLGIKARVDLGLGQFEAAEGGFRQACERFLELGRPHKAAYIALELAQAYLDRGRTEDLEALTTELLPVFQSYGETQPDSLAAITLLGQAIRARTLTATVLQDLGQDLYRSSR